MEKNSLRLKDIRYILNKIGAIPRKRYNYDLLEQTYLDYLSSDIDDSKAILMHGAVDDTEKVVPSPFSKESPLDPSKRKTPD